MRNARIKRVYEPPLAGDGARILIDRLWPRGVSRQAAALTLWLKEIAPSPTLRQWFGHDPARWSEFRRRYRAELEDNASAVARVRELQVSKPVTLVYAARDQEHNHARVLAEFLNRPARPRPGARTAARTARR